MLHKSLLKNKIQITAVSLSVYVEIGDYDLAIKYPKLDQFYKNITKIPEVC